MNASEFYEEFKSALDYLGVRWADMEEVTVTADEGYFFMSAGNKTIRLEMKGKQS